MTVGRDGAIRVLLVDASPSADATASNLGDHDRLSVVAVDDPERAVQRVDAERVDCVVSEYDLPGTSGLDLLAAVREADPGLPFVLFTADGDEALASEAITAGVTDYVRRDGGEGQHRLLAARVADAVDARRARTSYREIFDEATDGIVVHDPETGDVLDVNERMCDLLGYDREELVGSRVEAFTADAGPHGQAEAERRVREAARGEPQVFEWLNEREDGTRVPVEVHLSRTTIGGRDRVLAMVRDISERRTSERKLRAIVENTAQAIYIKDTEGRYELINEPGAAMFGATPEEVVGKRDDELFEDADGRRIREIDEEIMASRESRTYERRATIDGEQRVFINNKFPYRSRTGEVLGVIGISQDITERKQRERELQRQNERLEEFASVVSHDLRNPLNVAQGCLDLLATTADDREHVDRLDRALCRMEDIVDDVLTLARQGQRVDDPVPVDAGRVVTEAWGTVDTADADLVATLDATVAADRSRLRQLLENLFRNAVQHGGEDVRVEVGPLSDGFYVEDDGPGVPADDRDSVFESGYSTAEDGTGLGLAIVETVAEAHGWEVALAETDGGARFEVTGVEVPA